ncbi:hypothetical protein GGI12_005366 [Dipsacomyces acuminosporus]|nr:hypothetical protein GGI12_005366 [Dipsacomyces acuminosporus]
MVDELVSDIRRIESEALSSVSAAMADSATPVTRQAKDCVHALLQIARRIMELTRDVRLDALNYQLQTVVRPWLLKHAVEYERSKMEQMLQSTCKDTGAIGDKTTKWMSDAAARERDGQCTLSSRSSAAEPPSAPKPKHVFFEALLDLCFARTPLSAKDTPATLALDVERICYIQNQIQVTLSTAALCMLIKTLVKQDQQQQQQQQQNRSPMSSADMASYAEELLELLGSSDVTMDQIVAAVQKAIGAASASSTAVLSKAADRLVRKTLSTEDPVFRAIEQQLRMYFLEELDKDEMPGILEKRLEQESASATASGLSRAGLDIVRKDVVALLLSICRLGQFNWQIHCKWYSKVGL